MGALTGQSACRPLALAREAIDSTRAVCTRLLQAFNNVLFFMVILPLWFSVQSFFSRAMHTRVLVMQSESAYFRRYLVRVMGDR